MISVAAVLLAAIAAALIIGEIKLQKRNAEFREKYTITASLASIYEDKVKIIDYSDGSVEYMSFEDYTLISEKEIIVKLGNEVFSFRNGEKEFLFSSEHDAWNRYLRIGDEIYFIAWETYYENHWDDEFLWVYKDGKIEKAMERPVSWNILPYGDDLIFTNNYNEIMIFDTETGNVEKICGGTAVCWKEEGKSFFYFDSRGIHLYDMETKTKEELILINEFDSYDENINLQQTAIYNEKDEVLNDCILFHADFHFTAGIYDVGRDEFISEREYSYGMGIERKIPLVGYNSGRWATGYPIEWIY